MRTFEGSVVVVSALAAFVLAGCSSSSTTPTPDSSGSPAADAQAATPPAAGKHGAAVSLALTAGADGIIKLNDIQGPQSVPSSKVIGTGFTGVVFPGGEQPGNAQPIAIANGKVGPDLKSSITIPPQLADGFYELAVVISISGKDPKGGPDPADLVGFTDPRQPPPAGEAPYTGQTVRFRVKGADATVTVGNDNFIPYGAASGK